MNLLFSWRKQLDDDEIRGLEEVLDQTLVPVQPRPTFVQNLQYRLMNEQELPAVLPGSSWLQYVFLSTAILLGLSFVMITSIRVIITIVGLFGLFHQFNQRIKEVEGSPPFKPA